MRETIRAIRGSEGLRNFSKRLGVSCATISRIENGKECSLKVFADLCRKLDLDANQILKIKDTGLTDTEYLFKQKIKGLKPRQIEDLIVIVRFLKWTETNVYE